MFKKIIIAGVLVALAFSPLYAQEMEDVNYEEEVIGDEVAEDEVVPEEQPAVPEAVDGSVSLDFRDADIQNVLRNNRPFTKTFASIHKFTFMNKDMLTVGDLVFKFLGVRGGD